MPLRQFHFLWRFFFSFSTWLLLNAALTQADNTTTKLSDMAPWWLLPETTLLFLVFVSLSPVLSQSSCDGGGVPGIPGTHGANGKDGPKGEKGEPGDTGRNTHGLKGDQGLRGTPGRPGLKGEPGHTGPSGFPGRPGEKGRPFNPYPQRALFSMKRELSASPENDQPMDFNRPILPNLEPSSYGVTFNGSFVCTTPGVYFFSFHISVKSRVCLKLMKGSEVHLNLCDNWQGFLVTSSSAILHLQAGDVVSLQTTRYNTIVTALGSSHTFNGFLIYKT